jgi:hypothetical protein
MMMVMVLVMVMMMTSPGGDGVVCVYDEASGARRVRYDGIKASPLGFKTAILPADHTC